MLSAAVDLTSAIELIYDLKEKKKWHNNDCIKIIHKEGTKDEKLCYYLWNKYKIDKIQIPENIR